MARKTRLTVLTVILLSVIMIGCIFVFSKDKSAEHAPEEVLASTSGFFMETCIAQSEVDLELASFVDPVGSIVRYSGGAGYFQAEKFYDLETAQLLFDFAGRLEDEDIDAYAFDSRNNLYYPRYNADGSVSIVQLSSDPAAGQEETLLHGWKGWLVPLEDKRVPQFLELKVDANYYYLLSAVDETYSDLQVFTRDGALYMEVPKCQDFDLDRQGNLFVASLADFCMYKYDMENRNVLCSVSCTIYEDSMLQHILYEERSGLVYLLQSRNIYAYQADDLIFERIVMERAENMLECQDEYLRSFYVDQNQNIFCLSMLRNLYRYTPTESREVQAEPTLTISAPYPDDYILQAIALYEREHPEQHIHYDYAYASMAEFNKNAKADNYFEQANLRLLSGDIGDIVMNTSAFPFFYDRLFSDLFVDLLPFIEEDEIRNQLDTAALEGMLTEGQMKALPVAAHYYYAEVNTDLAEKLHIETDWQNASWSEIIALHEQLEGTEYALFSTYSKERLLSRILISNMPDLIDYKAGKMDLKQPWFTDLLLQIKTLWNAPNFIKVVSYSYLPTTDQNVLIHIDGKTEGKNEGDVMAGYVQRQVNGGTNIQIIPLFCGEKNSNRTAGSQYMYSISAWSEHKIEAWGFLRFLVEQQVQKRSVLRDRPMNLEARADRVALKAADQGLAGKEAKKYIRQHVEEMQAVYETVDAMYDMGEIKEILWLTLCDYMDGELSLDEVLAKSEEALLIRINE